MKYSIAFSALASVAAVYAESVYFVAVSEDKSLNFPIFAAHETAGSNYFLDASVPDPSSGKASPTIFELKDGVATVDYGTYISHLGVENKYFASGPAISPQTFSFKGDAIENYNFFACKNTNDPYKYSKKRYIIAVSDKSNNSAPFEECTPVNILKHAADAPSSSSSMTVPYETTSTISTTSNTDLSSSMNAPSEIVVTRNSSSTMLLPSETAVTRKSSSTMLLPSETAVTTRTTSNPGTTVTDYTTYCPESTTVTVTVCSENLCTPREYTVTTATTLTIPGECVIAPTEAPSVPSVSTANAGVAMAASGALGLAGIAAIFL